MAGHEVGDNRVWRYALCLPYRFKMLRFLKKHTKRSKKRAPAENPTHGTTAADVEQRRDPQGEHVEAISRTDKDDRTDSTIAPATDRREGPQVVNQDGGIENQQPPALSASTPIPEHGVGNTGECGQL